MRGKRSTRCATAASRRRKQYFDALPLASGKIHPTKQKIHIPVVAELLVQKKAKAHRTRTTRKRLPMTWTKFEEYFAQAAHGGYSHSQLEANWEKLQETGTKSDRKGVIAGVGNQRRLWVSVSSEEASDALVVSTRNRPRQRTKMRSRLRRWRNSWMEASRWAKAVI